MQNDEEIKRLRKHLIEQYNFLTKSCNEYDAGDKTEAKRIALALRILAHDTQKSHGLLSQLEKKTGIKLLILSRNSGFSQGLIYYVGASMQIKDGVVSYQPMMDLSHPGLRKITLEDWWEQGQILVNGINFTRKDIMLTLVNKEGGAHIDPKELEDFKRLTDGDLINLQNSEGEKVKGVELVLARENGFFMSSMIEENFSDLIK